MPEQETVATMREVMLRAKKKTEDDCERIVAVFRACEGIPTDELKRITKAGGFGHALDIMANLKVEIEAYQHPECYDEDEPGGAEMRGLRDFLDAAKPTEGQER